MTWWLAIPIRNNSVNKMAVTEAMAMGELNNWASQAGQVLLMSGTTSTAIPNAIESPSTNILRKSSIREVHTCIPAGKMNAISTNRMTPMTGRGITARNVAICEKKDRTIKSAPTAKAT